MLPEVTHAVEVPTKLPDPKPKKRPEYVPKVDGIDPDPQLEPYVLAIWHLIKEIGKRVH